MSVMEAMARVALSMATTVNRIQSSRDDTGFTIRQIRHEIPASS